LAFIIRTYHGAQSSECPTYNVLLILIPQSYTTHEQSL